ncbi:DUF402 domain-containing protein [Niallia sp. HCP3S3_B10]|uniref:DUF402 domain-containing protein n=1 Tax=Niallia sp. HCP3S3_B10 TaxID=3438944 RepID=UPI003F89133A
MPVKRKFGNHKGWKRILEKHYAQTFIITDEFTGYLSLFHSIKVAESVTKRYNQKEVCILDDGYMWLHQYPLKKNHSITTMFNGDGEIVQWYIDICLEHGTENNVPWMDDLFLDIVVLPSKEVLLLDEEELEDAYRNRTISKEQYDLAWKEASDILEQLKEDQFRLLALAEQQKKELEKKLK